MPTVILRSIGICALAVPTVILTAIFLGPPVFGIFEPIHDWAIAKAFDRAWWEWFAYTALTSITLAQLIVLVSGSTVIAGFGLALLRPTKRLAIVSSVLTGIAVALIAYITNVWGFYIPITIPKLVGILLICVFIAFAMWLEFLAFRFLLQ